MDSPGTEDHGCLACRERPTVIGIGAHQQTPRCRARQPIAELAKHATREVESDIPPLCREPDTDLAGSGSHLNDKPGCLAAAQFEDGGGDLTAVRRLKTDSLIKGTRLAVEHLRTRVSHSNPTQQGADRTMRIRIPQSEGRGQAEGDGRTVQQSDFRHDGLNLGGGLNSGERGGSLGETGGVGFLLRNAAEAYALTEDQQESLRRLRTSFELEKVDKLAALSKAKILLRALANDVDAAEKQVMEAIDHLAACEADLRKMRYHHLKAARAHLDTDQRERLVSLNRQRLARRTLDA